MVFGDDPSQGYVRDRSFIHPGLGVGFTVPDGFVIDNTSEAVLATGVDGTALRFDAVALAEGADLGEYLASGLGQRTRFRRQRQDASPSTACRRPRRAPAPRAGSSRSPSSRSTAGATYRFIFANEAMTPAFENAATTTVGELPQLARPEDLAGLQAAPRPHRHGRGRRHRRDARPADARRRPAARPVPASSTVSSAGDTA